MGTDNETEDLTYIIIESPSSGEIEISGNEATYTPEDYYNGEVTFSYVAIDETDLMSNEATVNITIWPQNDAPEGSTQSVEMEEDSSITIELYGYDIDGDEITYDVLEDVKSGELYQEVVTHTVIYTPTENYVGEVSFSYQVNDGLAQSSEEIIWITMREYK